MPNTSIITSETINLSDFVLFLSVMKNKTAHQNTLSIILEEPDIQIREVKESEEWEDTQMTIYDMGIARGRIDSIFEILEEYGNLSDNLRNEILAQTDMDILKKWFKLAAKVSSIDEFAQKMHE